MNHGSKKKWNFHKCEERNFSPFHKKFALTSCQIFGVKINNMQYEEFSLKYIITSDSSRCTCRGVNAVQRTTYLLRERCSDDYLEWDSLCCKCPKGDLNVFYFDNNTSPPLPDPAAQICSVLLYWVLIRARNEPSQRLMFDMHCVVVMKSWYKL